MSIQRRDFLGLAAAASILPANAWAADYPDHPVRIVSPFPPGGSADSIARALAERLSQRTGKSFFIENRPGAGGGIGADLTAKSAPDGYTIVIGAAGAMAINKTLYKSLPYDPVRDFAPITMVGYSPVLIVANPQAPAKTVDELVAAAKQAPGKIAFASNGNGTAHHLTAELFQQTAGVEMTHVPYNGTSPAVKDVIAGLVPYGFLDLTLCLPLMQAGRLRGIATTGPKRSAAAPNIPTVDESGLRGFDAVGWFGLFAPARTPAGVIAFLNTQVGEVLKDAQFQATALRLAVDTQGSTPEALRKYQEEEIAKWAKVIRIANVTIE
ncbi:MAG: tripartite tricarboxylate transporter substrate binding protein [Gammaproteobacteria bacterium]|nr:tripartite tricarboxylate transporter substrate binding protein [Gammaproteobacteria bacterium]MBU1440990.1 tripartite tricarboxylate transporter substrate binding protein [Gammaproteobacteria bacterium]MBU2285653.1 tripartite tricarboxylate transporter substrate binding protein [Gammaproteobacteria bacterium]